jgi:hypothetical protein
MSHNTVFAGKHSPWLRAIIASAMLVLALLPYAGPGGKQATGAASASTSIQAATATPKPDPDLCALLPSWQGVNISSSNRTQKCTAINTTGAGTFKEIEITKYSSPAEARKVLDGMFDASIGNFNHGKWDPFDFYGDPGYGYTIGAYNLDYPGGAFARGCYVVVGETFRHPAVVEDLYGELKQIDSSLIGAPCGGGPQVPTNALRVVISPDYEQCAFRNQTAAELRVWDGPPASANSEHGTVRFIIEQPEGNPVAGEFVYFGDIQHKNITYGMEIRLPSEAQQAGSPHKWKIELKFGPGLIYQMGPTGSIKIPCDPTKAAIFTQGLMQGLMKPASGSPGQKIETDNAIITPAGGGGPLYGALSVSAQAEEFTINVGVDARDPAKTGITLYAGSVLVTPKNSALAPVTLTAGQRVDVAPATISVPAAVVEVPGVANQSFPETGKAATGIFMDYWRTHGGLAQQGYPISGLIREKNDLNGKTYTVQYFERAVFEFHTEYANPNDVLLSQLGTFQYKRKYPGGAPNQRANTSPGARRFPETGKTVGGKFLEYWNNKGGLAQQGLPLSEEFTEVSETDGKTYTVQYFERAVFELHPEFAPPNDVLLSLLGAFTYKQKYEGGGGPGGGTNPTATPVSGGGNPNCSATTNIAATSNGGSIAGASSDFGLGWKPERIIDGKLDTGWASDADKNTNQYVIVALPRGQTYAINKVRINPANTAPSCCPDDAVKDFEIRVSTTDANIGSFRTVFQGTTPMQNAFFDFTFQPAQAKYVMLFVKTNHGGRWIEVKEFEVYQSCDGAPPPPGNPTVPPPPPPPGPSPTTVAGGPCSDIPANINMTVSPTNCAKAGSSFVFEATGFNPGETIGAYATGPDGQVYGGNFQLTADQNGNIRNPNGVTLSTQTGTPPGIYALTMEGVTSRKKAIGYIKLLAP